MSPDISRTRRFDSDSNALVEREWLVTNGLGGYAAGTVSGVPTRRFHGLLIAALGSPNGRAMMLNQLEEVVFSAGERMVLGGEERVEGGLTIPGAEYLAEFRLEVGLPVWRYEIGSLVIEKRIAMVHGQNTVHVTYTMLAGDADVRFELRPAMCFRPHEGSLQGPTEPYALHAVRGRYEISAPGGYPPLRFHILGEKGAFSTYDADAPELLYRLEKSRGYDSQGSLTSPGFFHAELTMTSPVTLIASTESWQRIDALSPADAREAESARRTKLLTLAEPAARLGIAAELVLAADQFIVTPQTRLQDAARAQAAGNEVRTVIAGYHWFTDWGRDTMISLEGLTLVTGRHHEAGFILRTFAHYVKDGLIPNMFPEGENEGLYHTADATLWFFHALSRYMHYTSDSALLSQVLPTLIAIADAHLEGTRFGIGVDQADGLLRQGQEGYQLTWMDAKMGDWVVTPRRGKAVEINALFYNALCLLAEWLDEDRGAEAGTRYRTAAARVRASFNERFWYEEGQHLFDVVDTEGGGDDPACRPNQLLAVSLSHAVLDEARWTRVFDVCRRELATPVGLRSLSPRHPDYEPRYFGDLKTRDGAYHQGTVWGWLIGPYVDAWSKAYPEDEAGRAAALRGFVQHLDEACIGSVSEIFDAELPFTPRGCAAQAWSVAELLRVWVGVTAEAPDS
ncbi:MAG: glycogen debranching protein [Proteobacteria bacterium]|nr:MAG: glycogen debranching protein [Pseudomonadota bacterium]